MGLDMYLSKKTYIGGGYAYNGISGIVNLERQGKKLDIKLERITYIIEQIGYWRKANMIHSWFVENVQNGNDDCGSYWVHEEQLKDLLDLVQQVLDDHSLADTLLPTTSGFFFGNTEYDDYYFKDLQDTKKILKTALKVKDAMIEYHSSW